MKPPANECPDQPTGGRPWPGTRITAKMDGALTDCIVDEYDWWLSGYAFPAMYRRPGVGEWLVRMLVPSEIVDSHPTTMAVAA